MIEFEVLPFEPADFPAVYSMIKEIRKLTIHTPYTYWVIHASSPDTFLLAKQHASPIGLVCGLTPFQSPKSAFLWQIGVLQQFRAMGIGDRLLSTFFEIVRHRGFERMFYTITDSNEASNRLFDSFARRENLIIEDLGETAHFGEYLDKERLYSMNLP